MKNRNHLLIVKALDEWGKMVDESVDAFLKNPTSKTSEIDERERLLRNVLIENIENYLTMENLK